MTSVQIKPEESMYHKDNGAMHHLSSLMASQDPRRVIIVQATELYDSDMFDIERRHELADQVTKKFALPQNYTNLRVVYVPQIECFLGIDLKEL